MLVRAARRKLQRNGRESLQSSFAQLQLPWLCPALLHGSKGRPYRSTTATKRTLRTPATISKLESTPTPYSQTPKRGLAYEAPLEHPPPRDAYVPFEGLGLRVQSDNSYFTWSGRDHQRGDLASLTFDPTSPLIIHDSLATAPRRFRSGGSANALGGELGEIHDNFRACLQVNKLDMAEAALRRLALIYKNDDPELAQLNNEYIAATTDQVVKEKKPEMLRRIQKWFEVNVRGNEIPFNGTTIAYMIRATFQEPNQLKIGRTIRRYIALAEEAGIRDETMAATLHMLSEQEVGQVTRLAPMSFDQAKGVIVKDSNRGGALGNLDSAADDLIPEIMPTYQKGVGLAAVQKSLQLFSEESPQRLRDTRSLPEEAVHEIALQRQIMLERKTLETALERWRVEHENEVKRFGVGRMSTSNVMGSLLWEWHQALVPLLEEEVRKAEEESSKSPEQANPDVLFLAPFLHLLSAERMSVVTILTVLNSMSIYGVDRGFKLGLLVTKIGGAVEDESNADTLVAGSVKYLKRMEPYNRSRILSRIMRQRHAYQQGLDHGTSSVSDPTWSTTVKAKFGAVLLSHLLRAATVEATRQDPTTGRALKEIQPAFWNSREFTNGKRMGVVRMNAVLVDKLTTEPVAHTLSKHLPMIVEPVPWTDFLTGGYTMQPVKAVRTGQHRQLKSYIRAASETGDMEQIFAGLDVLGKTPWKINRSLFNVMVEAWNEGKAIANIVPSNPEYEYRPEPDKIENLDAWKSWNHQMKAIDNEISGFHSQRCFQNFQLEVARAYLNETFYFPHSVDFRGRAYPVPPYLNHMGADNCRGLLMFGKGRELGSRGLTWLKVHLANVFGYDKASFEERRQFTDDHLTEIYDSATSPLKGGRWWLTAEDPWQCLAACMELKNALDSLDPSKYVSHLPIHQDGTCNGLQHYAALGGDSIGAKQVNLEPGDRPSDIYTAVADMVQKEIAVEAKQGNRNAQIIDGKINRKVVKHVVMTNVYGVTFSGAKLMVRRALEDLIPDFPYTPEVNIHSASAHIARKIFKALSIMFNGAHHIQAWLGECASRICESLSSEQMQWIEDYRIGVPPNSQYIARPTNDKNNLDEQMRFKQSVIWTTPLKMPVVQPYRNSNQRVVKTKLQHVSIVEPTTADSVDKRRQLQAFPPNFIHSLDATHMLLSALKCDEVGLIFAAVHDSFWTHAADVDIMNRILRDAFIKMHSEDVVGRLAAEFEVRYKGSMYLASVSAHSPLGKEISAIRVKARKAMPKTPVKGTPKKGELPFMEELFEERRRTKLLSSNDHASIAKAEKIITPTRLFTEAQTNSPSDLISKYEGEVSPVPVGEVSSARRSGTRDDVADIEPLELADADEEVDPEDVELLEKSLETDSRQQDLSEAEIKEAARVNAATRARKKFRQRTIRVWMPLTFPPVPEKGDFDVSRLRDSQYFFS
ncbi:MAG: DNA-directed RNA polymerase [Icmadophila ericetorum]|nr:DNA-directed RNA polymerase [Icmadophila ericetorum]